MIWGRWFGQLPVAEPEPSDDLVETVVYRFLADEPGRCPACRQSYQGGSLLVATNDVQRVVVCENCFKEAA